MDALVGDALRSYSRYWLETFRLPSMDLQDVVARTDGNTHGREHLDAAPGRGPGRDPGPAALRQLGRRRRLAGRAQRTVHHRRRTAQARVAVRPLRRVPRVARHGGPRADRRRAPALRRPRRAAAAEQGRVPARRPRPVPPRRRGRVLRRAGPDAGRARRCSRAGPAPRCSPVHAYFAGDGWGNAISPPLDVAPDATPRAASAPRPSSWPTTSPRRIAEHPADWHMLQKLWLADLPRPAGPRRTGGLKVRIGIVCPYSWDIPGGVQAHVRDLAEKLHRARPRRLGARARRRRDRRPAALRRGGRQGRADPVQRLGRPACSSGWCRPPGCGAGCATAPSTSCTCTSRRRRACRCSPA